MTEVLKKSKHRRLGQRSTERDYIAEVQKKSKHRRLGHRSTERDYMTEVQKMSKHRMLGHRSKERDYMTQVQKYSKHRMLVQRSTDIEVVTRVVDEEIQYGVTDVAFMRSSIVDVRDPSCPPYQGSTTPPSPIITAFSNSSVIFVQARTKQRLARKVEE